MKLKIIGFWGAYPKASQASSCYLISTDTTNVLLDLGSGSLAIMQKYLSLADIDAVIISHFHGDHFADAFCLQHAVLMDTQLGKRSKTLDFYAPLNETYFKELNFRDCTKATAINENSKIQIGDLSIQFAKTVHPIYGLSMRVKHGDKVLVYSADTELNKDLQKLSQDCDLLLSECSIYKKYEGLIKGHMSGKDVAELASKGNVKQVVVTHLPNYDNNNDLIKDIKQGFSGKVTLAQEGLEFII